MTDTKIVFWFETAVVDTDADLEILDVQPKDRHLLLKVTYDDAALEE